MRHDAERDAARFVGDAMSARDREAFTAHLLSCADCWSEVHLGRRGRSLAESTRTAAPAALREHVRGLVDAESHSLGPVAVRSTAWRRWLVPVGVPVAAAAALAMVLAVGRASGEPPALREAVSDFSAQELPGTEIPDQRAPDLTHLQLQPIGAGGGSYAGLEVDGYAYRDPAGRRVVLYLSEEPFPEAPGAQLLAGPDGPWIARRGDVVVLCARLPHSLLVVGQDDQLVRSAASALGVL